MIADRQNEETLRQSEERFRLMVESVKDYAIFMLDAEGKITTWNEGAKRTKGYDAQEIIGLHFSVFYPAAEVKADKPGLELKEAARVGRFEDEGWRVRKDGTQFWANVVITALRDKAGHLVGFGKVTRDLTERKKAEDSLRSSFFEMEARVHDRTKELAEANLALERALNLRDEFLSVASHELKTPMTSLKLQLQMARRRLRHPAGYTPERIEHALDISVRQVDRLTALVESLLDVSRIQAGKLMLNCENVDLTALCLDVVERFSDDLAEANCPIDIRSEPPVEIHCDRFRIEQVLVNLLTNAMKYGAGKPICISLRRAESRSRAEIRVRDQGIGIAADKQERIFERFERAVRESSVDGMGLGLYIARQIVTTHGGQLTVESELEKGSTFIVELPLRAE